MQNEQELELYADDDVHSHCGTGQSVRTAHECPTDDALLSALLTYRESERQLKANRPDGGSTVVNQAMAPAGLRELEEMTLQHRNDLSFLLHQAVSYQANQLIQHNFHSLAPREDELMLRGLHRLDNKELACGQLMAEFDTSISNYILTYLYKMMQDIARNMQSEAFLPDGGFYTKELIAREKQAIIERSKRQQVPCEHGLRSNTLIEMRIDQDVDDPDAPPDRVPAEMCVSETPTRQSNLRVTSLLSLLRGLTLNMVGKQVAFIDSATGAVKSITIGTNEQTIWKAWLGLSGADYLDLSEQELADKVICQGASKATVTRASSVGFAYLLQQPNLRNILEQMVPNDLARRGADDKGHTANLDAMEAALRESDGKSTFRKLVHAWMKQCGPDTVSLCVG